MSHFLLFLVCSTTVKGLEMGDTYVLVLHAACLTACSLKPFIMLYSDCIPHSFSNVSVAQHLTFILMMSATQLTCTSFFSQQKCLRRKKLSRISYWFPPHYFSHWFQTRWLNVATRSSVWMQLPPRGQFTDHSKLDHRWAGCHRLLSHG